jgi:hypothetical protein
MLITKEQQEAWLNTFAKEHTLVDSWAFVQGVNKALKEVAKGCIDKQTAIDFAQHLLKDFCTIEVTQETLNNFLNKK